MPNKFALSIGRLRAIRKLPSLLLGVFLLTWMSPSWAPFIPIRPIWRLPSPILTKTLPSPTSHSILLDVVRKHPSRFDSTFLRSQEGASLRSEAHKRFVLDTDTRQEEYNKLLNRKPGMDGQPKFDSRIFEPIVNPASPPKIQIEFFPKLRNWYSPAANIARKAPLEVQWRADQAWRDYRSVVGDTSVIKSSSDTVTKETREEAEQLAVRLLHVAFEDASSAHSDRSLTAREAKVRLHNSLKQAHLRGPKGMGGGVWAKVLQSEFPDEPWVQASVQGSAEQKVVKYHVHSWPRPRTETAVDLEAYGARVMASHKKVESPLLKPMGWNSLP